MMYEVRPTEHRFVLALFITRGEYPEHLSFKCEDDRNAEMNKILECGEYFSLYRGRVVHPYRIARYDLHSEQYVLPKKEEQVEDDLHSIDYEEVQEVRPDDGHELSLP